jgi:hypothetical protein
MSQVRLPSVPNPESDQAEAYTIPDRGRPILFQITDPSNRPLLPYLLALHTNPGTLSEHMNKSKTVVMTWGGFVEWIWPDELDSLSAAASTGAFLGPETGLTSGSGVEAGSAQNSKGERGRQGTMAWERQQDLTEIFRSNGMIYDRRGMPILRGRVICMYDRGIYAGVFTTFEKKETADKPYSFDLSWEFKVELTVYNFPLPVAQTDMSQMRRAVISNASQELAAPVIRSTEDELKRQTDIAQANDLGGVDPFVAAVNSSAKPL